jgi:hypothetical protein
MECGAIGWMELSFYNGMEWLASNRVVFTEFRHVFWKFGFLWFGSGVTTTGMNRFKQEADIGETARIEVVK